MERNEGGGVEECCKKNKGMGREGKVEELKEKQKKVKGREVRRVEIKVEEGKGKGR